MAGAVGAESCSAAPVTATRPVLTLHSPSLTISSTISPRPWSLRSSTLVDRVTDGRAMRASITAVP